MNVAGSPGGDGIGLLEATALAVGTMVGASIFSIFGLGARIAGHNLPLVFVFSGLVALAVAYSYAHLGSRIVSDAGPMEFILKGLGDGVLTGALSFVFWLTYVVSIGLFAKGFAGYFQDLVGLPAGVPARGLVEAGVVLAFLALGLLGSSAVGRAELAIVLVKLGILGVFVVVGIGSVDPDWIRPAFGVGELRGMLDAVAVFFLSYMGFGLVTNASEHMADPARTVPRAIYLSIAVVTVVYVLVAIVAVGNLPLEALVRAEENALAVAARPFLGHWGFVLVSVGALFSIASALNATLFGGANVAYALARDGELPAVFRRKLWFGSVEGLYLTAGLGIAFALLLDLNGIAAVTSSVMICIYFFVLVAHWRLRRQYGGRGAVIATSLLLVGLVFVVLQAYQWRTDRSAFWGTWGVLGGSFFVEIVYRRLTRRRFVERGQTLATAAARSR